MPGVWTQSGSIDPASTSSSTSTTVVEVEELVEVGEINPDCVHTPGIYVQRIVKSTINEKRIEKLTVRQREETAR